MISLKRIVEQQDSSGQYYDLGKDFAAFRKMLDGTFEQIKEKFEQSIGAKLIGKRVRARASRGYKQYVKDYEFDVIKISIDDYYDNYVVVAYDSATPKPKEYFLKPGFKITILGPTTGQPSPQKGGKPRPEETPRAAQGEPSPNVPSQQPSQDMQLAPAEPVKEDSGEKKEYYDAYSIENIQNDVSWLQKMLTKPETPLRDFIPSLGWMATNRHGEKIAKFKLKIPEASLKIKISPAQVKYVLDNISKNSGTTFALDNMDYDEAVKEWNIQIKKTTAHKL